MRIITGLLVVAALSTHAQAQTLVQQGSGVRVTMDWHTVAEPAYGAAYLCTWNDVRMRQGGGPEVAATLDLHLQNADVGQFILASAPIAVPSTGMVISFTRAIEMHPTPAERGTTLPNEPKDKCKNFSLGDNRATFEQRVHILDAATGKPLALAVDRYRFQVTRRQSLNDVVDNKRVTIDLTPFAGKRIIIQTVAIASYNGRGPAAATIASLTPIQEQRAENIK